MKTYYEIIVKYTDEYQRDPCIVEYSNPDVAYSSYTSLIESYKNGEPELRSHIDNVLLLKTQYINSVCTPMYRETFDE